MQTQMDTVVQLANKSVSYGNSPADKLRRKEYFLNRKGNLSPQEIGILGALGIDTDVQESMRQYLPEFFEKLPNCSDDTRLSLSTTCEVPYYVLWSAMFNRYDKHAKQLKALKDTNKTVSQLEHAMTNSLIAKLTSVVPDPVRKLFTLLITDSSATIPQNHPASKLFTLRLMSVP